LFDKDENGALDFGEIVTAFSTIFMGSVEEKFDMAFAAFDRNGDGSIDREEMFRCASFIFLFPAFPDIVLFADFSRACSLEARRFSIGS